MAVLLCFFKNRYEKNWDHFIHSGEAGKSFRENNIYLVGFFFS